MENNYIDDFNIRISSYNASVISPNITNTFISNTSTKASTITFTHPPRELIEQKRYTMNKAEKTATKMFIISFSLASLLCVISSIITITQNPILITIVAVFTLISLVFLGIGLYNLWLANKTKKELEQLKEKK